MCIYMCVTSYYSTLMLGSEILTNNQTVNIELKKRNINISKDVDLRTHIERIFSFFLIL